VPLLLLLLLPTLLLLPDCCQASCKGLVLGLQGGKLLLLLMGAVCMLWLLV
jgi:hypothetical protein